MNIGDLGGLVGKLLPLLTHFGIDPEKAAKKLGAEQVQKRLDAGVTAVAARLTKDKLTPAAGRQFIRAALYLLIKEALGPLPAFLRPHAADFLRDLDDEAVVALVTPHLTAETTIEAGVLQTEAAYLEQVF